MGHSRRLLHPSPARVCPFLQSLSLMSIKDMCITTTHCSFEYCQLLSSIPQQRCEASYLSSVMTPRGMKTISQLSPNQFCKLAEVLMPFDTSHFFSWCEQLMAASKLTSLLNFHTSLRCDWWLWHLSGFKNLGLSQTLSFWSWILHNTHSKLNFPSSFTVVFANFSFVLISDSCWYAALKILSDHATKE